MTEQPPATPLAVNADATEFEQISRSAAVPGSLAAAFWARYDTIVAELDALRRKVDEIRAGAVPDTPDPSAVIAAAIAYADSPDESRDTPSEDALLDAVHEYREAGGAVPDTGQARELVMTETMHVVSQHRGQEWRDVTPIRAWAEELVSHGGMNAAVGRGVLAKLDEGQPEPSGDTVQAPDVAETVAGSPVEAALAEIRTWLADDTPYCILPVRREHLPAVLARLDELEQRVAAICPVHQVPGAGGEPIPVPVLSCGECQPQGHVTPAAAGPEDLFAVHPSPTVGKAREMVADPAAYFERVRGAAEAALAGARAARTRPSDGGPDLPLSALFDNRDPHQDEMRAGSDTAEPGPVYVKPDEEIPHA